MGSSSVVVVGIDGLVVRVALRFLDVAIEVVVI